MPAADPAAVPPALAATALRAILREQTAADHDRLDCAMAALDLANPIDYARFLRVQLAAREVLEANLTAQLWANAPPLQAHLIRADLAALNAPLPNRRIALATLPTGTDLIGACWALAGSHLGNRMMLARLAGQVPESWPVAFLSDPAITAYWATLRERLARPATANDPAIPAARAVFATFIAAAAAEGLIETEAPTRSESSTETDRTAA